MTGAVKFEKIFEKIPFDIPISENVIIYLNELLGKVPIKGKYEGIGLYPYAYTRKYISTEKFPITITLATSTVKIGDKDHEWKYLTTDCMIRSVEELVMLDILIGYYRSVIAHVPEIRKIFGRGSFPGKHSFAIWNLENFQKGETPILLPDIKKQNLFKTHEMATTLGIV